jgi:precorrin-8X/cobalt-precorrin-8 methylmutase
MNRYIKDPLEIEEKSFEMIRAATDLSGFTELEQQVVMRLVHTCGNPEIAGDIHFSKNAVQAGIDALNNHCTVLCDVEMVKQGLTKRFLDNPPLCFLNKPEIIDIAKSNGESRTMTALQLWEPHLGNSIAIIGNAPTALFRLMELIEQGSPKPDLVIGIPVGFVGAPESKQYLAEHHQNLGVEYITVAGRTGGSALAAGAFNTLVRLKRGLRF